MPAKPKLTAKQRQRILEVVLARRALPSDKQLARELGISVSAIYRTLESMLHDLTVSRETKSGILGSVWAARARLPTNNDSDC